MNDIGQRILNETNLLVDDVPHVFKGLVSSPQELLTWKDVEFCMNNPYLYKFEMIDQYNNKIHVPEHRKAWMWESTAQDKRFLFEKLQQGHSLIIMNYGFYNEKTMEFLQTFEKLFNIHAAMHVYCGLQGSKSFTIHDDYPANFIVQIEGKTRWKIFDNRISYLYKTGTMNGSLKEENLKLLIDVTLEPGDALYFPSRMYHVAYPDEKRLSISIPCWNAFATDPPNYDIDRNFYRINHDI
jgi:hypothetical protein